jgi:hypothetical protein
LEINGETPDSQTNKHFCIFSKEYSKQKSSGEAGDVCEEKRKKDVLSGKTGKRIEPVPESS